jgi:hypothetical protein
MSRSWTEYAVRRAAEAGEPLVQDLIDPHADVVFIEHDGMSYDLVGDVVAELQQLRDAGFTRLVLSMKEDSLLRGLRAGRNVPFESAYGQFGGPGVWAGDLARMARLVGMDVIGGSNYDTTVDPWQTKLLEGRLETERVASVLSDLARSERVLYVTDDRAEVRATDILSRLEHAEVTTDRIVQIGAFAGPSARGFLLADGLLRTAGDAGASDKKFALRVEGSNGDGVTYVHLPQRHVGELAVNMMKYGTGQVFLGKAGRWPSFDALRRGKLGREAMSPKYREVVMGTVALRDGDAAIAAEHFEAAGDARAAGRALMIAGRADEAAVLFTTAVGSVPGAERYYQGALHAQGARGEQLRRVGRRAAAAEIRHKEASRFTGLLVERAGPTTLSPTQIGRAFDDAVAVADERSDPAPPAELRQASPPRSGSPVEGRGLSVDRPSAVQPPTPDGPASRGGGPFMV